MAAWLESAQTLVPTLNTRSVVSIARVVLEKDSHEPLGWRYDHIAGDPSSSDILSPRSSIIWDFGDHYVGHFSVTVHGIPRPKPPGDIHGSHVDAPARLRITFGEVARDVAEDFHPYTGWLSESWLPQEIVNVDFMPYRLEIPRRHAFRFVRIDVVATSDNFNVKFENVRADVVTSANLELLPPPLTRDTFRSFSEELTHEEMDILVAVDKVSIRTLTECMQTVFEDGPRRDRRLWLGDLRVQALTYFSLGLADTSLIKRCILLHAALPYDDTGRVAACIFEHPMPHAGNNFIVDYSLLFGVTLLEYVQATGDDALGRDLFALALKQLELAFAYVDRDCLFSIPDGVWLFIDWVDGLDKQASMQGVVILACKALSALADRLGLSSQAFVPHNNGTLSLSAAIDLMTEAAYRSLWDPVRSIFVSGPDRQVSWASQAWLILADACPDPQACMKAISVTNGAVAPKTPYGHHYVVDAYLHAGLKVDALRYIARYWGSMITAGADTFFEAWDPSDPQFSPYGDAHVNSYCHGWSCTPAYFLRSRLKE
ncbi:hypothetical protein EXIGLDRAFT_730918 [Exidia glandulosa HHB12029]|uniref:Glycosyl hydrolase family 78 alpha-rhamnosidase N-terminal domain-containing protein n=1 Tax=Exidia glandulosa HHB12029 TaxID=1314781 RepID=A0A165PXS5_EXIGL|nr:hypothetical protein EXIGLDRAFT_730918 [Exidia glandulosa HHB12029]